MFKSFIQATLVFFLGHSATCGAQDNSVQRGKYFDRAIIVIFENKNYSDVMKLPFFKKLSDGGASFSNFLAITHPSQPNYIALTSGSVNGVTSDRNYDLDVTNIVDLFEAKGVTWKVYVEDYPGNCFTGSSYRDYARKHNPFISYLNIQKNPSRCANIVSASQFDQDAANNKLPNYIFYIPNNKNNGHDTTAKFSDMWYSRTFSKYVNDQNFIQNTVFITTFDESEPEAPVNQIYTTIYGGRTKAGAVTDNLNTYSLLNMIEDNWSLGSLGRGDQTAVQVPTIWQ